MDEKRDIVTDRRRFLLLNCQRTDDARGACHGLKGMMLMIREATGTLIVWHLLLHVTHVVRQLLLGARHVVRL
jgi:hypothetical protein